MPNIEDVICRAMESGEFDNLPGKGKPLRLDENPFEDPEWRSAYRILKNSGFSLPWIEMRRELMEELEAARSAFLRSAAWREASQRDPSSSPLAESEWERSKAAFARKIEMLNTRIRSYNLETPSERFHLPVIQVETELVRLDKPPADTQG